ncbi:MAG TPA: Crp/Fnr family transcriptional regulator [Treponemataceae bacterium]|nr:Crp/Fnr family transcriptional regulator [Treponemataceae bacterium]
MSFTTTTANKSSFDTLFPRWDKLSQDIQTELHTKASFHAAKKGSVLHSGEANCIGLVLVNSGQLRAYIMSEEGKEITLYRLFEGDLCLFSASCILNSIEFDVIIEAEKDCSFWLVPTKTYQALMEKSLVLANYTKELMSARFSDVMWVIEQVLFKSMDKRIAGFLLDESTLENSDYLKITHEQIAKHLGTAREVVTRLLKYLQDENTITLHRGEITIKNKSLLEKKAT